jgi:probable rRNA maturation factor
MDELRPLGDEDDAELIGDVVLCPTIAESQAREAGHDTAAELRLLCTHGVLHLLGYDHHEPDDEREMFGLQSRLLSAWMSR